MDAGGIETVGSPALWAGFVLFVVAMLAIDLGVFHKRAHRVSALEAGVWSAVWVSLALLFNAGIWYFQGSEAGVQFLTGYLIEKSLSVDNIFVIALIFSYFAVPAIHQHRVLFWGILGALVMRAAFILAGGVFLQRFHWAIYLFGGILAVTGIKLLVQRDQPIHPEQNRIVRWFQRVVPTSHEDSGGRFTLIRNGRRHATTLLVALVAVEISDLVFAVDSIPAIFAVTTDPFIVFTSNIFAILGLRSLYFLLASAITRFSHLKTGLSIVLIFVGAKMLLTDVYKIPIGASLSVIAGILVATVALSLRFPARSDRTG